MLAKQKDSGDYPVAISHSVGASMDLNAQRVLARDSYDTLYPVDQLPVSNETEDDTMLILWGDVSFGTRHPSRITA